VLEWRAGDRVQSDHHQPTGVQPEGGLQRCVEPHATIAIPAILHAYGREQRLDRAGGLNMLDREPRRDVVDAALIIASR